MNFKAAIRDRQQKFFFDNSYTIEHPVYNLFSL